MVALPAVAQVIKVQYVYSVGEDANAQVALHFGYSETSPPGQSGMDSLVGAIHPNYNSNIKPLVANNVILHQIIATDLSSATGAVGVWAGSEAGTRGSTGLLSGETAMLMNEKVARRYKGGHPRSYWPWGLASDLNDQQTWTSTFVQACHDGWAAHLSAITSHTGPPTITGLVNVRYWSGGTWIQKHNGDWFEKPNPISGGPVSEPVTAWTFNPKPASQRRRMVRG